MARPPRDLAWFVTLGYGLLLVYASLYPFEPWRWPAGAPWDELLRLPWPPWRDRFDEWANVWGYVPFGLTLSVALHARLTNSVTLACVAAMVLAAGMSYGLECLQHFVPGRVPSLRDTVNNALGAAAGAMAGALALRQGWGVAPQRWRDRVLIPRSTLALVLLGLWPVGLLFPAPVPLGLGHVGPELTALAQRVTEGSALQEVLDALRAASGPPAALSASREWLVVALGVSAPALLAGAFARPGRLRCWLAPGATGLAVGVTTLSTALNFGPEHATAWMTARVMSALLVATVLSMVLMQAGQRVSAALGLVVLTALVVSVVEAPQDPYYAASLLGWEQGRFIRFHGLAQWVGLLWPYAAAACLMQRLTRSG